MKDRTYGKSYSPRASALGGIEPDLEGSEQRLEKQLLRSQSLEALGTVVGGIAHDFNNILNVITGHLSLMNRWRTDPERFMKSFDAVKKATDRGANTARQLLTFSRNFDVVTERVQISDVIQKIVGLLRETFPKNIAFDVKMEADVPAIPADPNQIHQALLNLCVNARDAMPKGGTISIALKKAGPADLEEHLSNTGYQRFVQMTVLDTGSGIDEEIVGQIFEPFFTTKGGLSNGLGLAVVYGIIKAHHGFIDVQSSVGRGTTFSIYFPILTQTAEPAAEGKEEFQFPSGHGEVILAIEDEEPLKDFLRTILTESGYRVLLASDGLEGLQTYRDHMKEVDVVLLDMGLPEMSGTEVLGGLLLLNPHAKVISATGSVEPDGKDDAMEMGALDSLTKPYRVEELLTKVHRSLKACSGTTQS